MTARRPALIVTIGAAILLAVVIGAAHAIPHYALAYQASVVGGQ